ncbi:MAG: hypothetical protein J7L63_02290 [Thermoplasmata archaeon]|nr:hypothetical protein [Thermoplasmata archaeon]
MMESYLLPQKLGEKLRLKFLKPTLKIGEDITLQGFLVKFPHENEIKRSVWNSLSPIIRNFRVAGITPFPHDGFPLLPAVIPYWIREKGGVVEVEGKIYDLSQFSSLSGRFILAEKLKRIAIHRYLLSEKPGLDGRKIYNMMELSFPEKMKYVMLPYFTSTSQYFSRLGGCTVTFLDSMSKYYASNFSPIQKLLREINPILRKERVKVRLLYENDVEIHIPVNFKIKYQEMKDKKALSFYSNRKGREWEKNAITQSVIKMEKIIGLSDIPFIPTEEEMQVYGEELKEYAFDIAIFALQRHLEKPAIMEDALRVKEKFIRWIDREFPLISEAMKMGVIMDMADVNGFGEHLARLINSWDRIQVRNSEYGVYSLYDIVFERIEDVLRDKLKREIASISEKRRLKRIINRVLWELNTLRPEGWSYDYFEKKMIERGVEDRITKIFDSLLKEGIVIRKREGYVAISSL